MVLLTAGGCDDAAKDALPPVPASLVYREELPLGDVASARMTRAANRLRDRLEPRWGPLTSKIYLLPVDQREAFSRQVREGLPPGWRSQDEEDGPYGSEEMLVFAGKQRLVAYVLINLQMGGAYPVQRLHN
jgi:hypothetical protein